MGKQPNHDFQKATLEDVARAVGISKSTASQALNGKSRVSPETRQAVLLAARRMGYHADPVAKSLSRGWAETTVGIFTMGLDLGVRTDNIMQIQKLLHQRGFDVPIQVHGARDEAGAVSHAATLRTLCRQRPRGIVCNTSSALHPDALAELRRYLADGGYAVCFDRELPLDCDQVIFDRSGNTYQSSRYLLGLGHTRIGFCPTNPVTPDHPWASGYLRALREAGITPRPDWIFDGGVGAPEDGGARLARHYLALEDRPSALCIINDQAASSFVNHLLRHGLRVPEGVSVVGHDDTPAARHAIIPLTTVRRPLDKIAHSVVEMLTARIDGSYDGPPRRVIHGGELVKRESASSPML